MPVVPLPDLGFARSAASFATSFRRTPADGYRQIRDVEHEGAYSSCRVLERFVIVETLGPGLVKIPFVDARCLDDGSDACESHPDLVAFLGAGTVRDGNAQGIRTETQRIGNLHR